MTTSFIPERERCLPPTFIILAMAFAKLTLSAQPVITTPPESCTNTVGSSASFWVVANGIEPLAYQWQKLSGNWSDLVGCTDTNLCLTNVQTSHAGDYRVVITNVGGAITSDVARLTVVASPTAYIRSLAPYQRLAVYRGSNTSLAITASGTAPLAFQWRLAGVDLADQTNNNLTIPAAQPGDEGDYTVVVTNLYGSVTSPPVRLYVTPPSAQMIRRDFTNAAKLRLPYWYLLPENYNPGRSYPVVFSINGIPGGENHFQTYSAIGPQALGLVFASYKQQLTDPVILIWPARRQEDGNGDWTIEYLLLILQLADHLPTIFPVDTNRIYMVGLSGGVHAVWDCLGSRPDFFAAGTVLAGWKGTASAAAIANLPLWVFCAADDSGQIVNTRILVRTLRQMGGKPIYTEHNSGGHMDGIAMGLCTPAAVDWLLAQRRGAVATTEPLLSITSPTQAATYPMGGNSLNLSGSAEALGQSVTTVSWTNFANNVKGIASGTNVWSATNIPLVANKTNLVVVVATTTSWSSALGGNTTFNDALTVIQSPIRANLALQGADLMLDWMGGGPPYQVQRATDLNAGDWTDYLPNATPPVALPPEGPAGFYRVIGR